MLSEAETYIELKNYNKARIIIEQALVLAKRLQLARIESSALIYHGKVYSNLGDNEKASIYANEGIIIAKKNKYAAKK